jgi:hypothetical protein
LRVSSRIPNILEIPSKYPRCVPNCVREKLTVTNFSQLQPK